MVDHEEPVAITVVADAVCVGPADAGSVGHPQRRVVLLGASNLTIGLPTVLDLARARWGQPLDIYLAAGHGRSYGQRSTVFGRTLPGIAQCGLWEALSRQPSLPTAALVTDVGNDLMYGAPVEQIIDWVQQCLDRLHAIEARTVMTLLPVVNLQWLSPRSYRALRLLLFPRCRLSLDEISRRAHTLDKRLRELGQTRGLELIEPRREWYLFDPIHVVRRRVRAAWTEILAGWPGQDLSAAPSCSWPRRARLRLLRPDQRWLLGREQRCVQPAARWPDGETISLF